MKKIRPSLNSRTPLFRSLREAIQKASWINRHPNVSIQEATDTKKTWNRRDFLFSSIVGASTLAYGISTQKGMAWAESHPSSNHGHSSKIVIVGAGIAGLNAAYQLKKQGIHSEVYEASNRAGGRIFTVKDTLAPGLVTEMGGEFIDSQHEDMLGLAEEFQLPLIDVLAPEEKEFKTGYFFDGISYTQEQVIEAFRPLVSRIQEDIDSLGEIVDYQNQDDRSRELDNLPLSAYWDRIGASGWIRKLLDVAYVTEYGLDSNEQSTINFLFLISTDISNGEFAIFGDSDERFKIEGGNQRITDELAKRVQKSLHLQHRLESIQKNHHGYKLTFEKKNASSIDVQADFVILAIPFTLLRNVNLQIDLPPVKMKAIQELGYGTNAKVMVGLKNRIWRTQGYSGEVFTDLSYQLAWDNSRLQPGNAGGITFFLGGKNGVSIKENMLKKLASEYTRELNLLFPGVQEELNGKTTLFHWPSYPYTLGSYACYRPGQWTTIAGAESLPVENIFFAGEHTSYDFQGFMNGAAETGRRAAEEILAAITRR